MTREGHAKQNSAAVDDQGAASPREKLLDKSYIALDSDTQLTGRLHTSGCHSRAWSMIVIITWAIGMIFGCRFVLLDACQIV